MSRPGHRGTCRTGRTAPDLAPTDLALSVHDVNLDGTTKIVLECVGHRAHLRRLGRLPRRLWRRLGRDGAPSFWDGTPRFSPSWAARSSSSALTRSDIRSPLPPDRTNCTASACVSQP